MAKIQNYIPFLFKCEGTKFVDEPNDRGGATKMGVTLSTWRKIGYDKDKDGDIDVEDLKLITKEDVINKVLKPYCWNKWKADEINNQSIAKLLVDWLWTSGKWGIIYPQQILNVKPDGIVGKITLDAINNNKDQKNLFNQLWNRRLKQFQDIVKNNPSQKKYIKGWVNRLQDLRYV